MHTSKGEILLIFGHAPGHPPFVGDLHSYIKVTFPPPNTTPFGCCRILAIVNNAAMNVLYFYKAGSAVGLFTPTTPKTHG